MSFAPQKIDVPSVDANQLHHAMLFVFTSAMPTDGETTIGDKLVDGPDLTELLDSIHQAFNVDANTVGALVQRAVALYGYCGREKPPASLMEGGLPGRVLLAAASTTPIVLRPGATINLATFDFEKEAMRAAIATAQN